MANAANCPRCGAQLALPEGAEEGAMVRCPQCQAQFMAPPVVEGPLPTAELVSDLSNSLNEIFKGMESTAAPSAGESETVPEIEPERSGSFVDWRRSATEPADNARRPTVEPGAETIDLSAPPPEISSPASTDQARPASAADSPAPPSTAEAGGVPNEVIPTTADRAGEGRETLDEPQGGLHDSQFELLLEQLRGGAKATIDEPPAATEGPAEPSTPSSGVRAESAAPDTDDGRATIELTPAAAAPREELSDAEQAESDGTGTLEFAPGMRGFSSSLTGRESRGTFDSADLSDSADLGEDASDRITLDSTDGAGQAEPPVDAGRATPPSVDAPPRGSTLDELSSDSFAAGAGVEVEPSVEAPVAASAPPSDRARVTSPTRPHQRRVPRIGQAATWAAGTAVGLCLGYGLLVAIGGAAYDQLGLLAYTRTDSPAAGADSPPARPGTITPAPSDLETVPPSTVTPAGTPSMPPAIVAEETPPAAARPEAIRATFESPSDTPSAELSPLDPRPGADPFGAPSEPRLLVEELFDEQPGAGEPIADAAPPALRVSIRDAPSYRADQLEAALVGADRAGADLCANALADGSQLPLIGRSYAKLCEVAQVLSFVDGPGAERAAAEKRAAGLFYGVFRHEHARSDSSRIAARWLGWEGKPHGGVFFSGAPTEMAPAGSVYEYRFDLTETSSVTALCAEPLPSEGLGPGGALGVVGCVIDSPSERVEGYTGAAERVVWVARVLALGEADLP